MENFIGISWTKWNVRTVCYYEAGDLTAVLINISVMWDVTPRNWHINLHGITFKTMEALSNIRWLNYKIYVLLSKLEERADK